ncbi:MAG TPA: UDP-N-acetylmuramate--L-alanine ligase [Flavobacteriaceae bacterium]|nr:UDP-N-acetylmuramate--L-alanine ligase [Flavobacteriaceae bacterium]
MKRFENIENVFFIGIGGIGMSALARYFAHIGKQVSGYDKTPSFLTEKLINEGILVQFEDNIENIPFEFQDTSKTLVVFTPAVSTENLLFQYFEKNRFLLKKRAAILGEISSEMKTLAVAGTHGKTTTTAILAHLLAENGVKLTAFLGGISENYQSNVILKGNEVMVVEADEFDRSFLQLKPDMAAITSMDADHLDIYGGKEALLESFSLFASTVPQEKLFYKNGLPLKGKSIGINEMADFSAENIEIKKGQYNFSLRTPKDIYGNFEFSLPGKHNLSNAVTALAMAIEYGIPVEKLRISLATFEGVERRFTYRIKNEGFVLIDDYAHHPAEITAVANAVKEMYPNRKVLAVFQPHLFSRTRDFANEFAESLAAFDKVLLLDIYPAREKPIAGINSEMLLHKIENPHKKLISKDQLLTEIKASDCSVVLLMGAGDIGEEALKITKLLRREN